MFGDGVDRTTGAVVCTASSGDVCGRGEPPSAAGGRPGALGKPVYVAVDSSSGPSEGDVYVADWETSEVSKFSSAGTPISSWGADGAITFPEQIGGIAVDSSGHLFVQAGSLPATVTSYDEEGQLLLNFPLTSGSNPYGGIAVDSSDDIYAPTGGRNIEKYSSTGADLGEIDGLGGEWGLEVDPSSGDLFVRDDDSIAHFDGACQLPDCEPIATFGGNYLGSDSIPDGLAIDSTTEAVYAVSSDSLTGPRVSVFFRPGVLPEVSTGTSSSVQETTATVSGTVDPEGTGDITDCRFEYLSESELRSEGYPAAKSAPCTPQPPLTSSVDVGAALSELQPDTKYLYRLVATNAERPVFGGERTFTTSAPPSVFTGVSSSLEQTSATATGLLLPNTGGLIGFCNFEYVDEAEFQANGYSSAVSAPCSPAPPYSAAVDVSSGFSSLWPGTTYHYRLVAANVDGKTVFGSDRTLTTAPQVELQMEPPVPFEESEEEVKEEPRPGHVPCSKHVCSRVLEASSRLQSWVSPSFPPGYGWVVAVDAQGKSLPHGHLIAGCIVRFEGSDVVIRVNGCNQRLKLLYRGGGRFRFRWKVH